MSQLQIISKTLVITLLILVVASCSSEVKKSGKMKIAVTVPTYADIVKQIAGDKVDVFTLLPPGVSPHDYDIAPNTLQQLAEADLYIRVGKFFNMEDILLEKVTGLNDSLKVFDSSQGIIVKYNNPHVWNGINEVKRISANISLKLSEMDPSNKEFYENNLRAYTGKIDSAKVLIDEKLIGIRTNIMITYHPALSYFTDSFGLVEMSIEADGREPNAKDLADLITRAKRYPTKAVFIQPQFESNTAKVVAESIGAELVVVDPLPASFLENTWDIALKIEKYNK